MTYGTVNVDSVVNSDGVTSGGLYGFKNRIINGAMVINQRAFSGAIGDETLTLDRWMTDRQGGSATATVSQSSTAPSGFSNSLLYTVGTGAATGATDYSNVRQYIEGFNTADLAFGTASASAVTLSFWVRSSLTGTFGVALQNSAYNRSYIASYTINSANTWEYKTISIPGDTSGTWIGATNGVGLRVLWDLGVGSTYSGAASGSWGSGTVFGLTGGVKLTVTSGATFYITGVQLEKGTQATSFDYRPYGTELLLCQRYFELLDYSDVTNNAIGNSTRWAATNDQWCNVSFKVLKRTTPSATSVGTVILYGAGSTATATPSYQYVSPIGLCMRVQPATYTVDYGFVGNYSGFKLSVSAEL